MRGKLTENEVQRIFELDSLGMTLTDIAAQVGSTAPTIRNILNPERRQVNREYAKEYYRKNQEHILATKRGLYRRNPQTKIAKVMARYQAKRDECKAYSKKRYKKVSLNS